MDAKLLADLHKCFDGTALANTLNGSFSSNTMNREQVIWRIITTIDHHGFALSEILEGNIEFGDDLKLHIKSKVLSAETTVSSG